MTNLVDLIFLILMSSIGWLKLGWPGFFGGLLAGVVILFVVLWMEG